MKALILVGGFGTRLRPLTFKMPKPLVPFVNKPMIIHQVEALKAVGVTEVILAVGYNPDSMRAEMAEWGERLGVTFTFSVEETPMGTAGPLALAREKLLEGSPNEPFFVLNSDVTCRFPLQELLAHHRAHGQEGTIMVTKVREWQKYGVVVYDETSFQIRQFVEKPQAFVGDRINAGIYIFNKSVINRVPLQRTMIETDVFPAMAAQGQLFCMELEGFWADIGQPHDYLDGLAKYLPSIVGTEAGRGLITTEEQATAGNFQIQGDVVIHPSAEIGPGCLIGPNVTIGPNCRIAPCARLHNCAIFDNSLVGTATLIAHSIVGWNNKIGGWCRIENNCVFGDDVEVRAELALNDVKVCPNKGIKASVSGAVVM